jgi:hypothetical protein
VPTREVSLASARSVLKERIIDALEGAILEALPRELESIDARNVEVVEIA